MNLKEFYDSLSEDLKAKVRACKSADEFQNLMKQESIELDPGLLDEMSGGAPYTCPFNTHNPKYKCRPKYF